MRTRSTAQPSPPNRLEILQSLRIANADGAFATAFGTLISGAFVVGFIQALGGKDLWIGLVSAIPSLAGLVQIPGAIWGRRYPSYRPFVIPCAALWRFLYAPLILLPFLPMPNEAKLSLVAFLVLAASVATMVGNPIYNDWLAEMVPPESRGFFFAKRNAIAAAMGAIVGLVGAFVLDALQSSGNQMLGYAIVFGLGILCATISFFFFMRTRDLPRPHPVRTNLLEGLKATATPFRDLEYRHVLIFLGVFTVGQVFAGNLFTAYALESLHLDFKIIQGTAVSYAIGNVLSARLWGFLSDKYGNKPMLMLSGLAIALNPIAWLSTIPGHDTYNAILLLSAHTLMGAFFGGVVLCQFNLMLATAKPEDRANYIGAGLTVTALVGGFAPLAGAAMMASLRGAVAVPTAYKLVFGAVMAFRIVSVFFLPRVKEAGASSVRETLGGLRRVTPRGYRAMRSLDRSATGDARADAIQEVGSEGISLAADHIVKALHDPLPSVRRHAAMAIAKLHDPRAASELIHQIDDHPDLLEEETVEALGILGNPDAVGTLIRTLSHPSPLIRRAAAKALGRVAQPDQTEAREALMRAAGDMDDQDLRRSSLQALRILGSTEAGPVFQSAILDRKPSVRVAAAEGIAELRLTEAADALRKSIQRYKDEASSETAYALGVVGDESDMPLILEEAARSQSMITRRRCLLGVARLLGVEREAYGLLLREGMERDTAINELLGPLSRRNATARLAAAKYVEGDESKAIELLARATKRPELGILAEHPVPELFLVAACAAVQPTTA